MKEWCIACLLLLSVTSCASAPAHLSSTGAAAYYGTRVIKALDLVRDTAIAAQAQQPPLLSIATTRAVVEYHKAAITIVHATPTGWKPTVVVGLDAVLNDRPPAERQLLAPYVALVKTILAEVP